MFISIMQQSKKVKGDYSENVQYTRSCFDGFWFWKSKVNNKSNVEKYFSSVTKLLLYLAACVPTTLNNALTFKKC